MYRQAQRERARILFAKPPATNESSPLAGDISRVCLQLLYPYEITSNTWDHTTRRYILRLRTR